MSRLVSSIHSLSSGLLLLPLRPSVSDSSRLKAACSAINHRLFIDLVDSNDNLFQIMSPKDLSHRLQQLYSCAFALAPHLDVRILLPQVPAAAEQLRLQPAALCMPSSASHHVKRGYGSHISV